jgi:hypothetical protein
MHTSTPRARRLALFVALGLLALAPAGAWAQPQFDPSGLPSRSLAGPVPERPMPRWVRTNPRIGHLPPGRGRMPESFAKAGSNVLILNALRIWDLVGPSADLYGPKEVARADKYLRDFVTLAHGAGARAVLYIGPVQVPHFSPEFVKARWYVDREIKRIEKAQP